MAKTAQPKDKPIKQRITPLPGGIIQSCEGIQRCGKCGGEVVSGRRPDGTLMNLTPVFGREHVCREPTQGDSRELAPLSTNNGS